MLGNLKLTNFQLGRQKVEAYEKVTLKAMALLVLTLSFIYMVSLLLLYLVSYSNIPYQKSHYDLNSRVDKQNSCVFVAEGQILILSLLIHWYLCRMKYEGELTQELMDGILSSQELGSDTLSITIWLCDWQRHLIFLDLSFFLYKVGILSLNLKNWSKDKKIKNVFLNYLI